MKILSIDSSSKNCSVSIVEANKDSFNIINEKNNNDERTHSQKLMLMIQDIFNESNISLNNIDLLASCIGPGSFTGIRIGVATVKAFADAKNIPTTGVTSLESLAYNIKDDGFIIPIIDAKNENVYSSIFSNNNHHYYIESESSANSIYNILDNYLLHLQNSKTNIFFVGNGSTLYKDLISEKFKNYNIFFSDQNEQSSISLAKSAYNKYINNIYGDSNFISPIYLRKSQAERSAINNEYK